MNKGYKHWNIFSGLNNWIIVNFRTNKKGTMTMVICICNYFKGVESIIGDNILSSICRIMIIDDEDTDEYHIIQLRNEPYTIQEDEDMIHYNPPLKTYIGDMICVIPFFLNLVHTVNYRFTKTNKGNKCVSDIVLLIK